MPKGIAMQTASLMNGQPIRALVARKGDGPFACDGCVTPVSFVNAHTKHAGDPDRERWIPAFFRLVTSRPPSEHKESCQYTTVGQVRTLVAKSVAIEEHLQPFTIEDGKQIFRLSMLQEAEKALPKVDDKEAYLQRLDTLRSSDELAPYFRSATGLAKLWILLGQGGGRRELYDLVKVKMGGRLIPWNAFFYEAEDTPKLAKRLDEDSPKYPIALLVRIREVSDLEGGRRVARCACIAVPGIQSHTYAGPSLFGNAPVMDRIKVNQHYVVFAYWRRSKDTTRTSKQPNKPAATFQNLSATIYQAAQYAEVDPPEE